MSMLQVAIWYFILVQSYVYFFSQLLCLLSEKVLHCVILLTMTLVKKRKLESFKAGVNHCLLLKHFLQMPPTLGNENAE